MITLEQDMTWCVFASMAEAQNPLSGTQPGPVARRRPVAPGRRGFLGPGSGAGSFSFGGGGSFWGAAGASDVRIPAGSLGRYEACGWRKMKRSTFRTEVRKVEHLYEMIAPTLLSAG